MGHYEVKKKKQLQCMAKARKSFKIQKDFLFFLALVEARKMM